MNVSKLADDTVPSAGIDHPAPQDYAHPCAWDHDFPALTVPALLAASVASRPSAPLVDFLGRTYSYADIDRRAQGFAAGLQRMGFAKGDRVGLYLPNVPIYPAAYYGAMIAGCTVVNFSPLYTAEELCAQVVDSGARLLVTIDVKALLPTAVKVLDGSPLETLIVGSLGAMLPWTKRAALAVLGRKSISTMPNRDDVLTWEAALVDEPPRPIALDAEADLALLQYTGGTTGPPKGAMLTHQNLTANARQVDAVDPFHQERDMILGALPLFHVFANTCVLNRTVAKGGCIAMLPRFDPGQALKTLARVKATAFPGVPTMYQALLDHPRLAKTDFSSLKVCISGGAPLPAPVKAKFEAATGARLVEGYGLTESSGVVSTNPYDGENRAGTIGQPLPGTRIRLLDKEDATRLANPGEAGEMAIKGPQIMRGYWNRPDTQAGAFADGWLRTGDVATVDAQGYVAIVDRIKDMIAVSGFKVFPSQIEAALLQHEAVREALVIGVPDPYRGEVPRAFATLHADANEGGDALRDWVNARIGKHERVAGVDIRADLPKTMIGKLDRKALRAEVLG